MTENQEEAIEMNLVAREPAAMIQLALSQGQDLDKLEKLLELQIRYEENEAKKAFHNAMARFKEAPPEIEKDKSVGYEAKGQHVGYKHASLANVTKKINVALSAHGLSATWSTEQHNGSVTVTCTVTHKLGHSESTGLTAAPDTSGSKNSIQAIGSTISYLQRYTILALTGLATSDMDDDGKTSEAEFITEEQIKKLTADIKKYYGGDEAMVLQYLQADSIKTVTTVQFDTVAQWIKDIEAGRAKKGDAKREPGQEG